MKRENDLLEETLSAAEKGYAGAYRFLLEEYEKSPESYGPQTLYFLACLAGGAGMPEKALEWLRKAVLDNGTVVEFSDFPGFAEKVSNKW